MDGIKFPASRFQGDGLNDAGTDGSDVQEAIVALLPRLRRFCLARTGSIDAADDLAQATIVRALERIEQWEKGTRLDSWMFRIAQNINIDEARARARRGTAVGVEHLEAMPGDDGRVLTEERSDVRAVRKAIAALPEDQRAIVALVILEGQSYKEAAATLGIPMGTVMSRLARARAAIGAAVQGQRG